MAVMSTARGQHAFEFPIPGKDCSDDHERFVAGWNFMGTFTTPERFFL
jgi:hypothetical protein